MLAAVSGRFSPADPKHHVEPASPSDKSLSPADSGADQENTPPVSAAPSGVKDRAPSPEVQSFPVAAKCPDAASQASTPRSLDAAAAHSSCEVGGLDEASDLGAAATALLAPSTTPEPERSGALAAAALGGVEETGEAGASPRESVPPTGWADSTDDSTNITSLFSAATVPMMPTPHNDADASSCQRVQTPRTSMAYFPPAVALPSEISDGGVPRWLQASNSSALGSTGIPEERPCTPLDGSAHPHTISVEGLKDERATTSDWLSGMPATRSNLGDRRLSLRVPPTQSMHAHTAVQQTGRSRRKSMGPSSRPDSAPSRSQSPSRAASLRKRPGTAAQPAAWTPKWGIDMRDRRMSLPAHSFGARQHTPRKPLVPWLPTSTNTTPKKVADSSAAGSLHPTPKSARGDAVARGQGKSMCGRAPPPPPPPFKAGKVRTTVIGERALADSTALARAGLNSRGGDLDSDSGASSDIPVAALRGQLVHAPCPGEPQAAAPPL